MALRFTVGEVPRTKPFQFADLAELMILVGLNSQVSKADLEGVISTGNQDSDPDPEPGDDNDAIQQTSKYERNSEDCFRHLSYRTGALDEVYPFQLHDSLLTPKSHIDASGYIYLFLLTCSRLKSFSGKTGFPQYCAKVFTELSAIALQASLKESAKIYIFDAGSDDRSNHFSTNLRDALRRLAVMLNAHADEDLISQQSTSGDGGLDLVAINSLGDSAKGILAYFGQCAAQQDGWPRKTLEARRTGSFFSMGHEANNLLYTPVMYRKATGKWVNDLYSHDCVIIDRLRMLRALKSAVYDAPESLFTSIKAVVDEAACAVVV
jgi:hypothetical protein